MARRWMVVLLLLLVAVSVPAAYKIYLVNGKVITADDKPVLRDGIAYFQKSGMELYLPVDQIDLVKTERGGSASTPAVEKTEAPKPASRKIGEDQLEEIRKRSRLANEGELRQPVYAGEEGAEGQPPAEGAGAPEGAGVAPGVAAAQGDRGAVQGQLSNLLNQRATLQKQLVDLQGQAAGIRDRYDTSTSQAEKTALQGQLDSIQGQLDGTRSQLSGVEATLQDTQQKLASMPVVVQQ